jgi:ribonuclease R
MMRIASSRNASRRQHEAARFLGKHGLPTLYRVHGEPAERRVTELQRMLRALGVGVRFPATIGTRELKQVSALIAGRPDVAFIEGLLIRSLPQAVYQPTNIGHFGLGLKEYAHFTSPIQRCRTTCASLRSITRSGEARASASRTDAGAWVVSARQERRADGRRATYGPPQV